MSEHSDETSRADKGPGQPDRSVEQTKADPGQRPSQYKHEGPDTRGNVDRGSDDDLAHDMNDGKRKGPRPVDDDLAREPGIGP